MLALLECFGGGLRRSRAFRASCLENALLKHEVLVKKDTPVQDGATASGRGLAGGLAAKQADPISMMARTAADVFLIIKCFLKKAGGCDAQWKMRSVQCRKDGVPGCSLSFPAGFPAVCGSSRKYRG